MATLILRRHIDILRRDINILRPDIDILRQDINILRQDIDILRRRTGRTEGGRLEELPWIGSRGMEESLE